MADLDHKTATAHAQYVVKIGLDTEGLAACYLDSQAKLEVAERRAKRRNDECELWVKDYKALESRLREVEAATVRMCVQAVDDAGGDNTQYHIDAIHRALAPDRTVAGQEPYSDGYRCILVAIENLDEHEYSWRELIAEITKIAKAEYQKRPLVPAAPASPLLPGREIDALQAEIHRIDYERMKMADALRKILDYPLDSDVINAAAQMKFIAVRAFTSPIAAEISRLKGEGR